MTEALISFPSLFFTFTVPKGGQLPIYLRREVNGLVVRLVTRGEFEHRVFRDVKPSV